MQKADDTLKGCKYCGAEYAYKEPCCPYCGATNEIGAEHQYMNKLHGLRRKLKKMESVAPDTYRQELKNTGRRSIKIVIVVAVVIAMMVGGIWGYYYYKNEVVRPRKLKQQFAWENKTFPTLDEWYEKGEYGKILQFMQDFYADDKNSDYYFFNWKHYDFMSSYEQYDRLVEFSERLENKETITDIELSSALYCAMNLIYFEEEANCMRKSVSDNYELQQEYAQDASDFLEKYFGMDRKAVEDCYAKVTQDMGIISYNQCIDYVEQGGLPANKK